ncbi:MAG: hypothetical protein EAZ15_10490 [Sphingobacteriales bacterium]|nr:MAG: hypothetical protein EAZ15_10490 [Sphingobacteriales bacterium]
MTLFGFPIQIIAWLPAGRLGPPPIAHLFNGNKSIIKSLSKVFGEEPIVLKIIAFRQAFFYLPNQTHLKNIR